MNFPVPKNFNRVDANCDAAFQGYDFDHVPPYVVSVVMRVKATNSLAFIASEAAASALSNVAKQRQVVGRPVEHTNGTLPKGEAESATHSCAIGEISETEARMLAEQVLRKLGQKVK